MLTLFQSSLIIASIAILWRSTLNKNKNISIFLKKYFPNFLHTALTCGLCFTYWVTLFFVLFFDPLPVEFFVFNDFTCCQTRYTSHLFLSWMFIGFSSVSFRFLYVFLQEKVNQIYTINHGDHNH